MNILIIAAHPDDEVLGVGGTIQILKKEGHKIISVITSYGEFSHPWMKEKFTIDVRKKECNSVKKFLGVDKTVFLGLQEGKFKDQFEKQKNKILNLIKEEKIKRIFTHSPSDPHPDHNACYNFVFDLVKDMNLELLCFDIWNPFMLKKRNYPKVYYDITPFMLNKNKAINMYKSQTGAMILLGLKPMVWIRAIINGLHIGSKFAEGFVKIK